MNGGEDPSSLSSWTPHGPWHSRPAVAAIVLRVRTLSSAEQYRSMAFAQLTYRESLRDIETCLSVHASKLYGTWASASPWRSTLADANEIARLAFHARWPSGASLGEDGTDEELGGPTNTSLCRTRDHRSVTVSLSVAATSAPPRRR